MKPAPPLFAVRAAFQMPIGVTTTGVVGPEVAYPYTFEDALAFENLGIFSALAGTGLVRNSGTRSLRAAEPDRW